MSSLMGLDQSQEHSIRLIKEDGGSCGLYGDESEKELPEISKPEVRRVIHEFDEAIGDTHGDRWSQ